MITMCLCSRCYPSPLQGLIKHGPCMAIMRVCKIFRSLCTKVYNPAEFDSLLVDMAESMALVEMEFPSSFFDVMIHLLYHLVDELDLCRLVSTRWMYPVERYIKTLKTFVRNMAQPEASMAEGYLKDECIGFITKYLQIFEAVQRRV